MPELLTKITLSYLLVFCFGMVTGASELLSRYRKLHLIFRTAPGWVYMMINGLMSILMLYILIHSGVQSDKHYINILVAGFSAMALLRSSFFIYKNKETGEEISIGLSIVIQVFLDWADRTFDQNQTITELDDIARIMDKLDYKLASSEMVPLAINFMENLSDVEKKRLSEYVKELDNSQISNQAKSLNLGKAIARLTGHEVLQSLKNKLGNRILMESATDTGKESDRAKPQGLDEIQQLIQKLKEV